MAIREGHTLEATDLESLAKSTTIKFGISSQRAAVGKMVRKIAKRDGFLSELEANKVSDFENVMTLAQALTTRSIDAAVIWDTTVAQINRNAKTGEKLEILCQADPSDQIRSNIAMGVVSTSPNPTLCLKLARFLSAPEKGKAVFESFGFTFLSGDAWREIPEIHLYCGSMFTPVIEETVREFGLREGINLYPKWEGCGKLVARMKAGKDFSSIPDAYFACDEMFLEQVQEHFRQPVVVTNNEIVMVVTESNKQTVTKPQDLAKPDLKVGICDPEQSALGALTQILLKQPRYGDLYIQLQTKAAVVVDVGPTLVSQLEAGGLDAAIVYRSNLLANKKALEKLHLVEFDQRERSAVARQPWAVSRSTEFPLLMERLFDRIRQKQVSDRFREFGFKVLQD